MALYMQRCTSELSNGLSASLGQQHANSARKVEYNAQDIVVFEIVEKEKNLTFTFSIVS